MIKNEVDQGEDDYVNEAIANNLENIRAADARQTLIQGHQVVLAEKVNRFSKA